MGVSRSALVGSRASPIRACADAVLLMLAYLLTYLLLLMYLKAGTRWLKLSFNFRSRSRSSVPDLAADVDIPLKAKSKRPPALAFGQERLQHAGLWWHYSVALMLSFRSRACSSCRDLAAAVGMTLQEKSRRLPVLVFGQELMQHAGL